MTKYIINPKLHMERTQEGDLIGILTEVPSWFKSSGTGYDILSLFKTPNTTADVINALEKNYDLPSELISETIITTIERFIENRILYKVGEESDLLKTTSTLERIGLQQLWVNLTNQCNLKCGHCFVVDKSEAIFTPKDKIFKLIDEAAEMNIQEIAFSGGEPTLHPDFLEIITRASTIENCSIKLITNATIGMTNNWTTTLDAWLPFLNDIQVSIDGLDAISNDAIRGEGTFNSAIEVIGHINDYKDSQTATDNPCRPKVGLSFTPVPQNVDSIHKLYKFAFERKVDYLHLNRAKKPAKSNYTDEKQFLSKAFAAKSYLQYDKMKENYVAIMSDMRGIDINFPVIDTSFDPCEDLFVNFRRERCGAGTLTLAINPNGDVYPCSALINRQEVFSGNVFQEPLAKVHKTAIHLMTNAFSVNTNDKCNQCSYKYFCGGGCRASSNTISSEDSLCDVIKSRYRKFWSSVSLPMLKKGVDTDNVLKGMANHE